MYHWPCRLLCEGEQVSGRAAPLAGLVNGTRGGKRHRHGGNMDTAVCGDRFREMFNGRTVAAPELPGRGRAAVSEMAGRHATSLGKPEFFGADMHMFHVTGFRPGRGVLTEPVRAARARLDVWETDPAARRAVSVPGGAGVLFSTEAFALKNSGNRTLRAPKPSWRILLDAAGQGNRLAGMTRINLKAMYNDPSQMREALAWRLFSLADIPAPRHTYAKLAFGTKYRGLFSVIEHVDKKFLRDHFGGNYRGNLYKTGYRDIGGAFLEYRTASDGDDSGRQYFVPGSAERTYRLQTNKKNPEASTYEDLACFIRRINGIGLGGAEGRFDTDAFRESVDGIMNVNAFLRWAAVNMLLGSWDNYYASGSNYYLYNSGHRGAAKDFVSSPYFHFIPWDYDNCLGIDYSGTQWQYADIMDWPGKANRHKPKIPLVRNLLRNHDYRQYYLDYLEHMLDTEFNPKAIAAQIGPHSEDGLWYRVRQAAYLESDTPNGRPFTGRRYSNDEVYRSGCRQRELRHGKKTVEGIVHYVRMRHDSARGQLRRLRRTMPRAVDRFPAAAEQLPRAA
jgi:hypothetical protein